MFALFLLWHNISCNAKAMTCVVSVHPSVSVCLTKPAPNVISNQLSFKVLKTPDSIYYKHNTTLNLEKLLIVLFVFSN